MNKLFFILFGSVWIVFSVIFYFEFSSWVDTTGWNTTTAFLVTDLFPLGMGIGGLFFVLSGGASIKRNKDDFYK